MPKSKKNKFKILGIITARGGSKGLPGKNIKILGGKPLIVWTIRVALKSQMITDLIVSTDDPKIVRLARKYGAEVPFLRPANLAKDTTPHLPVVQHAIKFMEDNHKVKYDYVVILQPTSPFRVVADIDLTLKKLVSSKADSAVTMVEVEPSGHPVKTKVFKGGRVVPYLIPEPEGVRKQSLPKVYKRSSAVYCMRRDLIMEENKIFGEFIVGHLVPKERSVDIDTEFDWLKAEYILNNHAKFWS